MDTNHTGRRIKTESIKNWAYTNLPIDSNLRKLILLEKNELEAMEFLNKIDTWLKLLTLETSHQEIGASR